MPHLAAKVVVSALVWADNQLLLLRRAKDFKEISLGKGLWELPGGSVDFGEEMAEALQRELTEEAGSQLIINDSLHLTEALSYVLEAEGKKSHRVQLVYSLRLAKRPELKLSKEHTDYQWISNLSVLEKLEMLPTVKSFLIKLFDFLAFHLPTLANKPASR